MFGRIAFWTASIALAETNAAQATSTTSISPLDRRVVRTLPMDASIEVRSGTYTPSGKVLLSYQPKGATAGVRDIRLATMNDDGSGFRPFFAGRVPDRPKDNGIRFMVFPDNRRVFLGDFVLECRTSLETCRNPRLLRVAYPPEVGDGAHIGHRWSEMIVARNNRHVAWTTLLSNNAATVLSGEMQCERGQHRIAKPLILSTLEPFRPDPRHADGVIREASRGGEVKQFVHGGTAISAVGAIRRDLPDSVVLRLDTGAVEPVTDTAGYTETTIFSPDERLGLTMSTRFSPADPAILGSSRVPGRQA